MSTLYDSSGDPVTVDEGESCDIVASFQYAGASIQLASLLTLKLTLYDRATGTILNSRDDVSIKNANDGSVTAGGVLTLKLQPADNVIADDTLPDMAIETHVARLVWTWTDGTSTRTGTDELEFSVVKLPNPA